MSAYPAQIRAGATFCCIFLFAAFSQTAAAKTLCVNPGGTASCFSKIQLAVNAASKNDVIDVAAGTYAEAVVIGKPLSLIGSGSSRSIIDAAGLPNGVFIDGFDNPGLGDVILSGFTVKNALFEGVLVVSTTDVTIRNNKIADNDTSPSLNFTGAPEGCPGQAAFETDETGDCGGALHLIGTARTIVSGNSILGNADGILISDETGESRDNLLIHNVITDNPLECGIVLASHPPVGHTSPPFAPHFGVDHNTVAQNVSTANGVKIGGSGVGIFSDGMGQGRAANNVIVGNTLVGNGLGGVALHTHVGPNFHLPADDMHSNVIIGNIIAKNLADSFDTATPGTVGINISSGLGGSPVRGTVISQNVIRDEDIAVAINTPADVDVHLNNFINDKAGAGNVCSFDYTLNKVPPACPGSVDATENFWGCNAGPGAPGCSTAYGPNVRFTPWLRTYLTNTNGASGQ